MQVNQSVNAANFLLVGSQAGNVVSTKDKTTEVMDFASVFQSTSSSYACQENMNDSQKQSVSTSSNIKDVSKESDVLGKDQDVMNEDTKTSDVRKDTTETDKTKESVGTKESAEAEKAQTENSAESVEGELAEQGDEIGDVIESVEIVGNLSEEDMANLLEAVGNLLQSIMEQFGLNADELSVKLDEFGMEMKDLLSEDGLKQFFLEMNGAEVSDLIVDENLNMELQAFLNDTSEDLVTLNSTLQDSGSFLVDDVVEKALTDMNVVMEDDVVVSQISEETDNIAREVEPEVVVVDNRKTDLKKISSMTDSTDSQEQQSTGSGQQTVSEEVVVKGTVTSKEPIFENPILQAIQNAVDNVEGTVVSEQRVQQTDIVRQVVEQVRLNMNQQTTSIELQLYPEHLGRIQINVVSKEGVMTASIVAETESAKQAIEAGLLNLKETMEQQDIKVEAIEVMVSTMGFEQSDKQQDSMNENGTANTRRKIDLSDLDEDISLEEEAEIEKMKASGSSVSYMA